TGDALCAPAGDEVARLLRVASPEDCVAHGEVETAGRPDAVDAAPILREGPFEDEVPDRESGLGSRDRDVLGTENEVSIVRQRCARERRGDSIPDLDRRAVRGPAAHGHP